MDQTREEGCGIMVPKGQDTSDTGPWIAPWKSSSSNQN